MIKAKAKIDNCVKQYKKVFKDEYKQFLKQMKDKEKREAAEEISKIFKKKSPIKRAMWDMPSTLYNLIINKLDPKELEWFNRKGYRGGQQYITKTFKEFKVPEK